MRQQFHLVEKVPLFPLVVQITILRSYLWKDLVVIYLYYYFHLYTHASNVVIFFSKNWNVCLHKRKQIHTYCKRSAACGWMLATLYLGLAGLPACRRCPRGSSHSTRVGGRVEANGDRSTIAPNDKCNTQMKNCGAEWRDWDWLRASRINEILSSHIPSRKPGKPRRRRPATLPLGSTNPDGRARTRAQLYQRR